MKLITEKTKVEALSSGWYKELAQKMKGFNKRQLWSVLDHYLFHVISDDNARELIRHLEDFEERDVPIDAAAEETDFFANDKKSLRKQREYRPKFGDTVTSDTLYKNKDRLDLLFDRSFFENYLLPEVHSQVADKLIKFAEEEGLPVQAHWYEFKDRELRKQEGTEK